MIKALKDQQIAIDKLKQYKVGALFMEPGTGKTYTAYKLIESVSHIDYLLWLTPFRTKKSLFNELAKYGGFAFDFDVEGIESLSNSDNLYLRLHGKLSKAVKPFIVVDESLKIKNWEAKRTKRILRLGELAEYKLVLNGTPLSKSILDLWAQMQFLSPKILKMSQTQYKNNFVEYTVITKHLGNRAIQKEFINKYHNIDYLFEVIEPYVFESNLKLNPKKKYVDLNFNLTDEEIAEHNAIKERYLSNEYMEFRNNNIFLEITQKLQHNYSCSPEKFELLKKILEENNCSKVLVFAKYIETQKELKKRFPYLKVLSWKKHAFGLNLQEYSRVVLFDKVWDYALRDQAEHRIYRIGQKEDVIFYDLTGNVGLEYLINKNIKKKQSLLEYFKNKSSQELMEML